MDFERVELLGLGGDQIVEGSEAVGDFLLFAASSVRVGDDLGLEDREMSLVLFWYDRPKTKKLVQKSGISDFASPNYLDPISTLRKGSPDQL